MSGDLERRYRRVLRLLPGWYREQWEQDMVAAFLDSWLTGDPEADAYISKAAGPGWAEVASVAALAARLYLVGAGTPRRFAWGQAIRRAALAVTLLQAVRGLDILVRTAWGRGLLGWLPAPPAGSSPARRAASCRPRRGTWWPAPGSRPSCCWSSGSTGRPRSSRRWPSFPTWSGWCRASSPAPSRPPVGPWAFWALLNLAPVAGMAAFRRDAPPAAAGPGRCWRCPPATSWWPSRCWCCR